MRTCSVTSAARFRTLGQADVFPNERLAVGVAPGAAAVRRQRRRVGVDRLQLAGAVLVLALALERASCAAGSAVVLRPVPVLAAPIRPATCARGPSQKSMVNHERGSRIEK